MARERIEDPLLELAANLLRVVRGAGCGVLLGNQMGAVLESFVEYGETVGHWPPHYLISDILSVRKAEPSDYTASAQHDIIRASLQIAASRLADQKVQERNAKSALFEGLRQMEKAQERQRQSDALRRS